MQREPPRGVMADAPTYMALSSFLRSYWYIILILSFAGYLVVSRALYWLNTRPPHRPASTVASMREDMLRARQRQQEMAVAVRDLMAEKKEQEAITIMSSSEGDGETPSSVAVAGGGPTTAQTPPAAAGPQSAAAIAFAMRRRELNQEYPNAPSATATGGHRLGGGGAAQFGEQPAVPRVVPNVAPRANVTATSAVRPASMSAPAAAARPAAAAAAAAATATAQPPQPPAAKPSRRFDDSDEDDPNGPRKRLPKLSGGDRAEWEARNRNNGEGGERANYFKRDCGPKGG